MSGQGRGSGGCTRMAMHLPALSCKPCVSTFMFTHVALSHQADRVQTLYCGWMTATWPDTDKGRTTARQTGLPAQRGLIQLVPPLPLLLSQLNLELRGRRLRGQGVQGGQTCRGGLEAHVGHPTSRQLEARLRLGRLARWAATCLTETATQSHRAPTSPPCPPAPAAACRL